MTLDTRVVSPEGSVDTPPPSKDDAEGSSDGADQPTLASPGTAKRGSEVSKSGTTIKGSTVATLLRNRPALSISTTLETTVESPTQAMHLEEVRRMRFFTIFAALMATTACLVIPFLDGDPLARNLHLAGTGLTAAVGFILAVVIRDGTRYESWMGTLLGLVATKAIATGFYFWGAYSAVLLMVPIGTYFFALGASYRGAVAIHGLGAIAHAALCILQIAGVVKPVGLIQPLRFETLHQAGMLVALQVVFLGAFIMARAVRKSSMDTLERFKPTIFAELIPGMPERVGRSISDVIDPLLGLGYEMHGADESGRVTAKLDAWTEGVRDYLFVHPSRV